MAIKFTTYGRQIVSGKVVPSTREQELRILKLVEKSNANRIKQRMKYQGARVSKKVHQKTR